MKRTKTEQMMKLSLPYLEEMLDALDMDNLTAINDLEKIIEHFREKTKKRYRLIDEQGMGLLESESFDTKEEVRQRLIEFHRIDWTGEISISKMSLNDLLEYGTWRIEVNK